MTPTLRLGIEESFDSFAVFFAVVVDAIGGDGGAEAEFMAGHADADLGIGDRGAVGVENRELDFGFAEFVDAGVGFGAPGSVGLLAGVGELRAGKVGEGDGAPVIEQRNAADFDGLGGVGEVDDELVLAGGEGGFEFDGDEVLAPGRAGGEGGGDEFGEVATGALEVGGGAGFVGFAGGAAAADVEGEEEGVAGCDVAGGRGDDLGVPGLGAGGGELDAESVGEGHSFDLDFLGGGEGGGGGEAGVGEEHVLAAFGEGGPGLGGEDGS